MNDEPLQAHEDRADLGTATPPPVVTAEQVRKINATRDVLADIAADCQSRLHAAANARWPEPDMSDFARLQVAAELGGEALFRVLNYTNAYNVVALTEEQIHNRKPAKLAPGELDPRD
ncbi:MAG: hypothetical protein ACRDUT_00120 [Mycobacterium sp.]